MLWIRIITCFVIYLCFSFFSYSNFEQLEGGAGYKYLFVMLVACICQQLLVGYKLLIIPKPTNSFLFLLTLLAYIMFKLVYDSGDLDELRRYSISTTNGIVFAVCMGFILSISANDLHAYTKTNNRSNTIISFTIIAYLFINLLLLSLSLKNQASMLRPDLFLIEDQEGNYQRPAIFILMQFIANSTLASLLLVSGRGGSSKAISIILLTSYAITGMFYSQLIGSNSGFVSILLLTIAYLAYAFVTRNTDSSDGICGIGIKSLLFGRLGKKLLYFIIIIVIPASFTILGAVRYYDVDLSLFRITGFGSGSSSSVDSRLSLIKNNFLLHLDYNPIFGNSRVESITTGSGSYVHSLMSIMTHHGLIGFLLFFVFLVMLYCEITFLRSTVISLYDDKRYSLYRMFSLATILIISLLTAFYTWMPLWFSIGIFGIKFSRVRTVALYSKWMTK